LTSAESCRLPVPQGRLKIARRFSAGVSDMKVNQSRQGRLKPKVVVPLSRAYGTHGSSQPAIPPVNWRAIFSGPFGTDCLPSIRMSTEPTGFKNALGRARLQHFNRRKQ
jgi:hypothetical protein